MVRKLALVAVPFIWFGAVIAISFMEAPLKFQAPGITIPLGLGIGRLVFFVLNKIELVLAGAFLLALLTERSAGQLATILFATVAIILGVETLWLLPVLDGRAQQVIDGTAEPFSRMHLIYIALDAIKVILLFVLGCVTGRRYLVRD